MKIIFKVFQNEALCILLLKVLEATVLMKFGRNAKPINTVS